MKLLHLDIETAPNLSHVWGLWQQNVALNQLLVPGYVLSWAAKWDGEREVYFARIRHKNGLPEPASQRAMLDAMHALLNEADAVITYNGMSFDIPTLNGEFAHEGMSPPAPVPNIDLMKAVKARFRLPSYKLEFVARHFGVGGKVKHEGHTLWRKCMLDDAQAWQRMERYNKGDVRLQERLYHRILGWIPNHPNRGLYIDDERRICRNCGSDRVTRQGERRTHEQRYARYSCAKCGAWGRGANKLAKPTKMRAA